MHGKRGIAMVWIGLLAGCAIEGPSQDTLTCNGNAMYPGAVCKDGLWVRGEVPGPQDMEGPDMPDMFDMPDLPDPIDLGEMDVPDMPEPDMPDMPDMGACSPATIASLCGGEQACGTTPQLLAQCPDASCPTQCDPGEQCVENQCLGCVMDANIDAQSTPQEVCEQAFSIAGVELLGEPLSCAMDTAPLVDFCGVDTSTLSCGGICPTATRCEAERCCVEPSTLEGLCATLSERELCRESSPSADAMVSSCEQGVSTLRALCGRSCPFDITDGGRLGSPSSGSGVVIAQHERMPADTSNLSRANIIYWLRPEDGYFSPASGMWTAVTGTNADDEDDASLFYASDTPLNVANSPDLLRSDAAMSPTSLNFNAFVDFGGGYVEFDRPSSFDDDVSAFFVVRNGPGDEVTMNGSASWYERPPILSGEWGAAGLDYGLTLNSGRLEWSKNASDEPALTSPDPLDDAWHIVAIRRDKNNATKMYIDGVEVASGNVPNASYESLIARIARHPSPQDDKGRWHGELAEMILYDTLVSVSVLEQINSYLAIKYGLAQSFDYRDRVRTFYEVSSHGEEVFGIACNTLTMPLRQSASRSLDGLWELRAGTLYSGVSSCPIFPARFSALMGHDGGDLAQAEPLTVRWEDRDVETVVLGREWKLRMTSAEASMASMTFGLRREMFTLAGGESFVPEFIAIHQDGDDWLFPLRPVPGGSVLSVIDFSDFSADGLDFRAPLYMRIGRFAD